MSKIGDRLTRQLAAKGTKNASGMAYAILNKDGLAKGSKLTAKGEKRQAMGNDGRAKDRAAKRSGGSPNDYKYNPKTNQATKKGR